MASQTKKWRKKMLWCVKQQLQTASPHMRVCVSQWWVRQSTHQHGATKHHFTKFINTLLQVNEPTVQQPKGNIYSGEFLGLDYWIDCSIPLLPWANNIYVKWWSWISIRKTTTMEQKLRVKFHNLQLHEKDKCWWSLCMWSHDTGFGTARSIPQVPLQWSSQSAS